jgi:hypothetical protein
VTRSETASPEGGKSEGGKSQSRPEGRAPKRDGRGGRSAARRAAPERAPAVLAEIAEREAAPASPVAQRAPRPERVREERRPPPRRRGDEDEGETPVGLGSHVPAFLLRPAVIKSPK